MEIVPNAGVKSAGELLDDAEVLYASAACLNSTADNNESRDVETSLLASAALSRAASEIAAAQFIHRGVIALERLCAEQQRHHEDIAPHNDGNDKSIPELQREVLELQHRMLCDAAQEQSRRADQAKLAYTDLGVRVNRLRAIEAQYGITRDRVETLTETEMREVLRAAFEPVGEGEGFARFVETADPPAGDHDNADGEVAGA